jgi:hypothetical protein
VNLIILLLLRHKGDVVVIGRPDRIVIGPKHSTYYREVLAGARVVSPDL